jgi:hypothetical protein
MGQSNPAIALGALVALGLLGGILFSTLSAAPDADEGGEAALLARVETLEQEVAALRVEVARRPGGGARGGREGRGPRPGGGAARLGGDEEAARGIARRALDAGAGEVDLAGAPLDPDDPVFQERVGEVVRETLEDEREQRWERRRERMEARAAERLGQFASDAGLDAAQVDEVDAALTQEREEIFAMFRAAREDGSWDDARARAEGIREQTDVKVGAVLRGAQTEAWAAFREEEEASRRP